MELQYTKIEYTINDTYAGVDIVNRVLTPSEIEKYVRRARRYMGPDMKNNVTFENHV